MSFSRDRRACRRSSRDLTFTVRRTAPPWRTRTQRWFGTSAYQTAPSASMQMPSGNPSPRSAQTRLFARLPSASISKAVNLLACELGDDQRAVVGRYGHPVGKGNVIGHLPHRTLAGDKHDGARPEHLAGWRRCAPAIDVDVAAAIDDDLVPWIAGEGAKVGVGCQANRPAPGAAAAPRVPRRRACVHRAASRSRRGSSSAPSA